MSGIPAEVRVDQEVESKLKDSSANLISSSIVVMKFGGTSVKDAAAIQRALLIVKGRRDQALRPVVVVSAFAGVTDQLLEAATAAACANRVKSFFIVDLLRKRHLETAAALVGRKIAGLTESLDEEFARLSELLGGVAAVGELTKRTIDLIVSYGERLSSRIVAVAFEHRGMSSAHVDARECIITDGQHGRAVPKPALIEQRLHQHVLPLLQVQAIPVLGGFIGSTEGGSTTTLGRGGSDYTAALVGSALYARAIEIWTDVDGIMTADPRICSDALRVKRISFEEASELAYFGAKVLHPSTILPAVRRNIPVWVLNSHNPTNAGTEITASIHRGTTPLKSIAAKRNLTIVHITSSRRLLSHGFLRETFQIFDRYSCNVNMVSTSEVSISVSIDQTEELPSIIADLSEIADIRTETPTALVCLVGDDIPGQTGFAERVFSAVRKLSVKMISQGANGLNLSFMVDGADLDSAVWSLHQEFFKDPDPSVFDVEERAINMQ